MTGNDDQANGGGKQRPKGAAGMSRQDAGFDRWLTGHLREMYDEVLREAVPEDLVRMVRQFDRPTGSKETQHQADEAETGSGSSRRRSCG